MVVLANTLHSLMSLEEDCILSFVKKKSRKLSKDLKLSVQRS